MAEAVNYERWTWWAERSAAALMVLMHLALTAWLFHAEHRAYVPAGILADSLAVTQFALITLWILFGPGAIGVRFLAIPMLGLIGLIWTVDRYSRESQHFLTLQGTMIILLLIAMIPARIYGLGMRMIGPAAPENAQIRFSIRGLLAITTLAAILLFAAGWVRSRVDAASEIPESWRATLMAIVFALATVLAAWALLRPGNPTIRFAIAAVLVPVLAAAPAYTLRAANLTLPFCTWVSTHAGIVVISLLPLRLMGYRLTRVRSSRSIRHREAGSNVSDNQERSNVA